MPRWETPKWRREGRTGPGPFAPKYSSRRDRSRVRNEDSGCGIIALIGIPAGVVGLLTVATTLGRIAYEVL